MTDKIKMTKKEFDEFYDVTETAETIDEVNETTKEPEPEFLTVEEQEIDNNFHQDNPEESLEESKE